MFHHSALWLWRPNVLGAMTDGFGSFCNQQRGIALASFPAGDVCFRCFAELFISSPPSCLGVRQAERYAGDQHTIHDHRQVAGQGNAGFIVAAAFAQSPRPVL